MVCEREWLHEGSAISISVCGMRGLYNIPSSVARLDFITQAMLPGRLVPCCLRCTADVGTRAHPLPCSRRQHPCRGSVYRRAKWAKCNTPAADAQLVRQSRQRQTTEQRGDAYCLCRLPSLLLYVLPELFEKLLPCLIGALKLLILSTPGALLPAAVGDDEVFAG